MPLEFADQLQPLGGGSDYWQLIRGKDIDLTNADTLSALADADIFLVDDGATGDQSKTNKITASNVKTYMQSGLSSDAQDIVGDGDTNILAYNTTAKEVKLYTGLDLMESTDIIDLGDCQQYTTSSEYAWTYLGDPIERLINHGMPTIGDADPLAKYGSTDFQPNPQNADTSCFTRVGITAEMSAGQLNGTDLALATQDTHSQWSSFDDTIKHSGTKSIKFISNGTTVSPSTYEGFAWEGWQDSIRYNRTVYQISMWVYIPASNTKTTELVLSGQFGSEEYIVGRTTKQGAWDKLTGYFIGYQDLLFVSVGSATQNYSDHTEGSYSDVTVTGVGRDLKASFNVDAGGNIGTVTIQTITGTDDFNPVTSGYGYKVGDVLTIPSSVIGGSGDETCTITSIGENNYLMTLKRPSGSVASTEAFYLDDVTINEVGAISQLYQMGGVHNIDPYNTDDNFGARDGDRLVYKQYLNPAGWYPERSVTATTSASVSPVDAKSDSVNAVNFTEIKSSDAGSPPTITAKGSDTNIDLNLISKGTGIIKANSNEILTSSSTGIDATSIADGTVTNTEFQYINSLTSNAQNQIDGKIRDVVEDTTPQLGGDLDLNGNRISESGNLTLDSGSDIILDAGSGSVTIKDDGGVYTPAVGTDVAVKSYVDTNQYHFIKFGYYATSSSKLFIPLAGAERMNESTSMTGLAEQFVFACPYDGSFEKAVVRSENICSSSDFGFHKYTGAGGEVPSPTAVQTVTVNMSVDNTSYEFDFASAGTNTFSKGDIIAFSLDTGALGASNDTHGVIVLKFDVST